MGVAAWIMGKRDLKEMNVGIMDPSGRSNTHAGKVCGIIATILLCILWLPILVIGLLALLSGTGLAPYLYTLF